MSLQTRLMILLRPLETVFYISLPGLRYEYRSDPKEVQKSWLYIAEFEGWYTYTVFNDHQKIHRGNHAVQNLENSANIHYPISRPLPKQILIKDYPENPRNFGEKLRKVSMDARPKIKELARMLDVTQDTVINWEVRGIRPRT